MSATTITPVSATDDTRIDSSRKPAASLLSYTMSQSSPPIHAEAAARWSAFAGIAHVEELTGFPVPDDLVVIFCH